VCLYSKTVQNFECYHKVHHETDSMQPLWRRLTEHCTGTQSAPVEEVRTTAMFVQYMVRNWNYRGGGGSLVMVFIQSSMKVRQLIKVIMEGETRADGRTDTIPLTCSSSWSKRRWLIRYKYLEMRNKLHAYTGDTTYRTGVIQSFVYLS